jgi:hypothetical protein
MKNKFPLTVGCLVQLNIDSVNRDNRCDLQGTYAPDENIFGFFYKFHNNDKSQCQVYLFNRQGSATLMRIDTRHCDVVLPSVYSDEFVNEINKSTDINEELCKLGKPGEIYPPFTRLKHEVIQEMDEEQIEKQIGIQKVKEHLVRCLMALDSAEERLNQLNNENIPQSNGQSSRAMETVDYEPVLLQSKATRRGATVGNGLREFLSPVVEEYFATTNTSERPISFDDFIAKNPIPKSD